MTSGDLLALAVFAFFGMTIITYFFFSYKHKQEVQNTIRKALDEGSSLTPELLDKLGTFRSPMVMDLRRGMALLSIGCAAVLAGLIQNEVRIAAAIGIFPLLLGLAFLLVWKMNRYND